MTDKIKEAAKEYLKESGFSPFNEIPKDGVIMLMGAFATSEAAREYWEGQGADAKFSYEDMMDIAGWMAAADCKRPIPELKEEAETYIKLKLAARSPLPAPPNQ